jgi:hypothetical protein
MNIQPPRYRPAALKFYVKEHFYHRPRFVFTYVQVTYHTNHAGAQLESLGQGAQLLIAVGDRVQQPDDVPAVCAHAMTPYQKGDFVGKAILDIILIIGLHG